ncbi:MAG: fructose-6-phosphate aldolase [Clostridiales bacterium]|jgi:TalC/MipB family fructose-6-phosphate aldolase|nr:fructose-6-phosphate aldolase [Clostridiales bacterium]
MRLLIDESNLDEIKRIWDIYPMDGVTTNPTILFKNGKPPFESLMEIRNFIGRESELHVQVAARDFHGMIKDAKRILEVLGESTFVKIPVTEDGLKAIKALSKSGARLTATAIYGPMQAFLAGKAGACYAAPYINRMDNLGANGVKAAKQMNDILKINGLGTEVLAASFKNSQQVIELCEHGIGACTISPEVMDALILNESVERAVDVFIKDFEDLCGKGVSMNDCK